MTGLLFKSSTAQLGSITMQPLRTADIQQNNLQIATITPTGTTQVKLPFFSLSRIHDQLTTPLVSVAQVVKSQQGQTLPGIFQKVSQVLPSFSRFISLSQLVDTRLSSKQSKPNPKFSPYEELTGISKIRPEILFVTTFKPIYDEAHKSSGNVNSRKNDQSSPGMNDVGEFIDTQIQFQNLKHEAILKLINDIKQNDSVKSQLDVKESGFRSHVQNLVTHANYLYDTFSSLDHLKRVLDLKSDEFKVDFKQVIFDNFKNFQQSIITDVENRIESNISFVSLLSQLGFTQENVQKFSNTKVCLQTILELENILKGFSNNLLGINTTEQQEDSNSSFINKHKTSSFNFDAANVSALSFDFLTHLNPKDVSESVTSIQKSFDSLFSNVHLSNDESKLAFIFQFLCKEFNFSKALQDQTFQTFVNEEYGFPISTTFSNTQMFDVMFGLVGEKITDSVNTFSDNSFANVAQKIIGDIAVLPFETDYVQYENSTYTPGSVYLVDRIAELTSTGYNVSTVQDFGKEVNNHITRLVYLTKSLNLFPKLVTSDVHFFEEVLGSTVSLFERVVYTFLDRSTNVVKDDIHGSNSCALFNRAQSDNHLKALLFLYVLTKTVGTSNPSSAQVLETVITQINTHLGIFLGFDKRDLTNQIVTANTSHNSPVTSVARSISLASSFSGISGGSRKFSDTSNVSAARAADVNTKFQLYQPIHSAVPADSLTSELKNLNSFLESFFGIFSSIFNAFTANDQALTGHFTRYSHVQDTTLMMVIFEALLSVISRYVNKQLVGQFVGRAQSTIGRQFYSIRSTLSGNTLSINTVRSKLNFDHDMTLKIMFTFLHQLKVIKDSIDNETRNLLSAKGTQSLNDILAVLGDRNLLSMVMNEQQVFLIKSLVDDITDKFFVNRNLQNPVSANVFNVDAEIQENKQDDLLLLDDSLVITNTKQALYSFFANEKFTSKKGGNIRLLTVGIPLGFGRHLREQVKVSKVSQQNYNRKQADIIRINVYKVDIEHEDIIFKPQQFLFELNRFISRNERSIEFVSADSSLDDILDAVPTRDYTFVADKLQKRDSTLSDSPLFTSSEYDFLSDTQKNEIVKNHVSSYFFELYIRLLTGLQLSEYDFLVDRSQIAPSSADPFVVQQMLNISMNKIFVSPDKIRFEQTNPVKVSALSSFQTPTAVQAPLGAKVKVRNAFSINPTKVAKTVTTTNLISDFSNMKTQYSDNLNESRRLFSPKSFDRIFNLAVDPDDFEIDASETLKSTSGKDVFNQLVSSGRIVGSTLPTTVYPSSVIDRGVYKIKERDKNEGDLTFEKYFVTFETVLETVI